MTATTRKGWRICGGLEEYERYTHVWYRERYSVSVSVISFGNVFGLDWRNGNSNDSDTRLGQVVWGVAL